MPSGEITKSPLAMPLLTVHSAPQASSPHQGSQSAALFVLQHILEQGDGDGTLRPQGIAIQMAQQLHQASRHSAHDFH